MLKNINLRNIQKYLKKIHESEKSNDLIALKIQGVKKFLGWAYQKQLIDSNIFQQINKEIDKNLLSKKEFFVIKKIKNFFKRKSASATYEVSSGTLEGFGIKHFLGFSLIFLFMAGLGTGIYQQFFQKTETPFAYPSSPLRSGRILSFQARLTDTVGNPINTATNVRFKLWKVANGGNEGTCAGLTGEDCLYQTGTCSITPDQDGIFSTLIGQNCGVEIPNSVFTENATVYLGVTVGADSEMTPRQQIANVAYAINAETLQGFPPGSGTSNIPFINKDGNMLIAASAPGIRSTFTSADFTVSSAKTTIIQSAGSGDVVLQATESGIIKFRTGGTTDANNRLTISNIGTVTISSLSTGVIQANVSGQISSLLGTSGYFPRWTTSGLTTTSNIFENATGNVGIGTTSPSSKLGVLGNLSVGVTYGGISSPTSGAIIEGNVGIGTTSPSNRLQVVGGVGIGSTAYNVNAPTNGLIVEGNVGVGTTAPAEKLDISGNLRFSGALMPAGSAGTSGQFLISQGAGAAPIWTSTIPATSLKWNALTNPDGNLSLDHSTHTTTFNTASTTGTFFTINANSLTSGKGLFLSSSATGLTGNLAEFVLSSSNAGNTGNVVRIAQTGTSSSAVPLMVTNLGTGLSFRVNDETGDTDTTPFVVDASGNVGVGTTGPGYKFHIGGGSSSILRNEGTIRSGVVGEPGRLRFYDSNGYIMSFWDAGTDFDTWGLYWDTTNNRYIYRGNGNDRGYIDLDDGAGYFQGNVGIGVTSPTHRLELATHTTAAGGIGFGTDVELYRGAADRLDLASGDSFNLVSGSLQVGGTTVLTSGRALQNLTGISSSGTITFSGLTANRLVATDGSSNLTTSISSANVANSVTDETGSGLLVFGTSPTFSTSILTDSTSFNVFNTTATTVNFAGAATTLNMGASSGTATINNATLSLPNATSVGIGGASSIINLSSSTGVKQIQTGGTTHLALMPGGNVGIGTTAPSNRLQVVGGVGIGSTAYNVSAPTNGLIVEGNVGVGTTSPAYKLDIQGGSGIVAQFSGRVIGANAVNSNEFVTLSQLQGGSGSLWLDGGDYLYPNSSFATKVRIPSGGLSIGYDADPGTSNLYIAGNVGVGTTNPSTFKLEVAGDIGPEADNTRNLGSATRRFANLYTSNVLQATTGTLTLDTTGAGTVTVGNTASSLNIGGGTNDKTINIGNTTGAGIINIGTSSGNDTINLLTGSGTNTFNLGASTSSTAGINLNPNASGVIIKASGSTSSQVGLNVTNSGNTSLFYVRADGNVGIGTTSPTHRLELATHTTAAGGIGFGTDVELYRGASDRLDLASGDSFNLVSGSLQVGGTTVLTSGRALQNLTGISSSGTITFSGLTPNRLVATDGSSNLVSTITADNLRSSVTGTTGTGNLVFSTSPTFSTSILTDSSSFNVFNTTATTVNFAGAATTLNMGASSGTATINNATLSLPNATSVDIGGASSIINLSSSTGVKQIQTGGTTHLALMPGGNVGIGITSPSERLDISGNLRFSGALMPAGSAGTSGQVLISQGTGNAPVWTSTIPATSLKWNALTNPDGNLTLDHSTHTTTFNTASTTGTFFTINANLLTSGKGLFLSSTSTGLTGNLAEFVLSGSNAGNTGNVVRIAQTGTSSSAVPLMVTNLGTGLSFRVNDETGDTDTTPFVIDASGNVGVGTTSPGEKLDVIGNLKSSAFGAFANQNVAPANDNNWNHIRIYSGAIGSQIAMLTAGGSSTSIPIEARNNYFSIGRNTASPVWDFVINTGNVGIGTTAPAERLDVVGRLRLSANTSNIYLAHSNFGSWRDNQINLLSALAGRTVNYNPDFLAGTMVGYSTYDNNNSGDVSRSIVSDATAPNDSEYIMRVQYDPNGGPNSPSPGFGGFFLAVSRCSAQAAGNCYKEGNRYIWRIWARIPTGRSINFASNAYGTGGTFQWITSQTGTGNWREYVAIQTIGSGGTFSTTGFFFITGGDDVLFTWDVAQVAMIGIDEPPAYVRAPYLNIGYNTTYDPGTSFGTLGVGGNALIAGNVGIGTTSPSRRLSIIDSGVGLDRPATNVLGFYTANTERMRIDSTGNVGIGVTSPTHRLELATHTTAAGGIGFGTDVELYRGASDRLDLASGDSFNLVSGSLQVGGTTVLTSGRALQNLTGISSSGTITFSGLTPNRLVATDGSSNLVSTITADNLRSSVTGTTGTGNLVFSTSPTFSTSILTDSSSFNVFNTTATTINAFGAATTLNMGANSGTLTIGNPTVVGTQTTQNLWNTTATTVNFAGAATTLNMGASSGTATINNATLSLPNATSVGIGGASLIINLSSSTGVKQIQTGGTTHLALMPGGNVGIGTTSPSNRLQVVGGVGIGSTAYNVSAPTNGLIVEGNVGVGTTSLIAKLDVNGNIRGDFFIDSSNSNYGIDPAGTSNFGGYSLRITSGALLAVDTGNVGIGTTAPTHKLELASHTTADGGIGFGTDVELYRGAADRLDLASGDSFNLVSGSLQVGGTTVLTSGRALQNLTGISSSGTITFSGLTPNRLVATDGSSNLVSTITADNLRSSVTGTTGTGNLVFSTSPTFSTSILTDSSSFNVFNTTATTINAFGAATTLNMGASSGTLTIGNPTVVGTQTTQNLWNTTATTVNFAGAATTLNMGASSGTATINNATLSLPNATSVGIGGASSIINLSSSTGVKQIQTGGTTHLALMPGGNVGVGTTNPLNKLDVVGDASVSGALKIGVGGQISAQSGGDLIIQAGAGGDIWFRKSDGSTMAGRIDTSVAGGTETQQIYNTTQNGGVLFVWHGSRRAMQSFTTSSSFSLSKATLRLYKTGGGTYNVYVNIYTADANDKPNILIGTSDLISSSSITGSAANYDFNFSTKPLLNSASKYVLVLISTSGSNSTNYVNWLINNSGTDVYPDGKAGFSTDDGYSWTTLAVDDSYFITYSFDRYGTLYINAVNTSSADLAERYPSSENLENGVLVSFDTNIPSHIIKSRKQYDYNLVGIVSSDPGLIMGSPDKNLPNSYPIALIGRVPTQVCTQNGPIKIGDPLTSSSIPGVAMKSTKAGKIVGRALESYDNPDPNAVGKIMVFINVSWYDPDVYLTSTGDLNIVKPESEYVYDGSLDYQTQNSKLKTQIYNLVKKSTGETIERIGAFSQLITATIKTGLLEAENLIVNNTLLAKNIVTENINLTTENLTIAGQKISDYIDNRINQILNTKLLTQNSEQIISPVIETEEIQFKNQNPKIKTQNDNGKLKIVDSHENPIVEFKTDEKETTIVGSLEIKSDEQKGKLSQLILKSMEGKQTVSIDGAGNASLSGTLTASSIVSNTSDLNQLNVRHHATIAGVLTASEASLSGKLIAKEIESENINSLTRQLINTQIDINDVQKLLAEIKNQPLLDLSNQTNLSNTTNLNNLIVTGNTNLYNASVSNSLTVGNLLIENDKILSLSWELKLSALSKITLFDGAVVIAKDGTITTKGSLIAQGGVKTNIIKPISSNDDLTIELSSNNQTPNSEQIQNSKLKIQNQIGNEVASIDASGSAYFRNLTLEKFTPATPEAALIAAPENFAKNGVFAPAIETTSASAGIGILPINQPEVIIYNDNVREDSLIYLTPQGTNSISLSVAEKKNGYFKIVGPSIHPEIRFDWLIIN